MGVVNVTPDSFSDGGRWATPETAIAHGRDLLRDGADILDIGGESTRPGATRPLVEEELGARRPGDPRPRRRGATVSVDTMRAEVAADGGRRRRDDRQRRLRRTGRPADPRRRRRLRARRTSACTGAPTATRCGTTRCTTVRAACSRPCATSSCERVDAARAAGVPDGADRARPGAGLRQAAEHNWALLARDPRRLQSLGFRVLVGASRKSFLGTLLADADGTPRPVDDREDATTALHRAARAAAGLGRCGCTTSGPATTRCCTYARWEQG